MRNQWRAGALGVVLLGFPVILQAVEFSAAPTFQRGGAALKQSTAAATYADLTQLTAFFLCENQTTTCDKAKEAESVLQNCQSLKNQLGGFMVAALPVHKLIKSYLSPADGLQIAAWTCVAEYLYFEKIGLKPGADIPLQGIRDMAMKLSGGEAAFANQPTPKCDASTAPDETVHPMNCPLPGSKGPVGGAPAPIDPQKQIQVGGEGGVIAPDNFQEVPTHMSGQCFGIDPSKLFKGNSEPTPAPADTPKPADPKPAPDPTPTPQPTPAPKPSTPMPPTPAGGLPSPGAGEFGKVLDAVKSLKDTDLGKSAKATFESGMPTVVLTWKFLPNPDSSTVDMCRQQFLSNMAGCLGAGDANAASAGDWMCGAGGPQSSYVADGPGGGTALPNPDGGGGMWCKCKGSGKSDDSKGGSGGNGSGSSKQDCCPDTCLKAGGGVPGGGAQGDICGNCSGVCPKLPLGGSEGSLVEDCLSGKAMSNPALAKQCGIINPNPVQNTIQPIYRMGMPGSFIEQWTMPRRAPQPR